LLNPMVLSTLVGIIWSALGIRIPMPVDAYLNILADALAPCALFAIGLGLSIEALHANIGLSLLLAVIKLVIMPLIVFGLSIAFGLSPLYTIAAVICAAVPTAKTVYILAGEYRCEETMVAATVSMTTLFSVCPSQCGCTCCLGEHDRFHTRVEFPLEIGRSRRAAVA
jgi:malonate transporter and related proteins